MGIKVALVVVLIACFDLGVPKLGVAAEEKKEGDETTSDISKRSANQVLPTTTPLTTSTTTLPKIALETRKVKQINSEKSAIGSTSSEKDDGSNEAKERTAAKEGDEAEERAATPSPVDPLTTAVPDFLSRNISPKLAAKLQRQGLARQKHRRRQHLPDLEKNLYQGVPTHKPLEAQLRTDIAFLAGGEGSTESAVEDNSDEDKSVLGASHRKPKVPGGHHRSAVGRQVKARNSRPKKLSQGSTLLKKEQRQYIRSHKNSHPSRNSPVGGSLNLNLNPKPVAPPQGYYGGQNYRSPANQYQYSVPQQPPPLPSYYGQTYAGRSMSYQPSQGGIIYRSSLDMQVQELKAKYDKYFN